MATTYRIIGRVYSFDKTKVNFTSRPYVYTTIQVASQAAIEWLREMSISGETASIVRYKPGGLHVWANRSTRAVGVSAEAEVIIDEGEEALQVALSKLRMEN